MLSIIYETPKETSHLRIWTAIQCREEALRPKTKRLYSSGVTYNPMEEPLAKIR